MDPALGAVLAELGPKAALLLRPTLFLRAGEACEDPPDRPKPGATRLGGRIDVASGFSWPRLPNVGAPLAFLAQFDLAALRPLAEACSLPLPGSGRLLFFYDLAEKPPGTRPEQRVHWRVMRDPMPESRLRKHPFPEDLPPECALAPRLLNFVPGHGLPPAMHPAWAEAGVKDNGKIATALARLPMPPDIVGALGGWGPAADPGFEARAALFADGTTLPKAWQRFRSLLWFRGAAFGASYDGLTMVFLIEEAMLAERRFEESILQAELSG